MPYILESNRAAEKILSQLNDKEIDDLVNLFDRFGDEEKWYLEKQ